MVVEVTHEATRHCAALHGPLLWWHHRIGLADMEDAPTAPRARRWLAVALLHLLVRTPHRVGRGVWRNVEVTLDTGEVVPLVQEA